MLKQCLLEYTAIIFGRYEYVTNEIKAVLLSQFTMYCLRPQNRRKNKIRVLLYYKWH